MWLCRKSLALRQTRMFTATLLTTAIWESRSQKSFRLPHFITGWTSWFMSQKDAFKSQILTWQSVSHFWNHHRNGQIVLGWRDTKELVFLMLHSHPSNFCLYSHSLSSKSLAGGKCVSIPPLGSVSPNQRFGGISSIIGNNLQENSFTLQTM